MNHNFVNYYAQRRSGKTPTFAHLCAMVELMRDVFWNQIARLGVGAAAAGACDEVNVEGPKHDDVEGLS